MRHRNKFMQCMSENDPESSRSSEKDNGLYPLTLKCLFGNAKVTCFVKSWCPTTFINFIFAGGQNSTLNGSVSGQLSTAERQSYPETILFSGGANIYGLQRKLLRSGKLSNHTLYYRCLIYI